MSKKWKITVGVAIAAVVVGGVALAVWGTVTFRNRVYEHGWQPGVHKWGPEATTQLRCPEPCPEPVEGPRRRVVEGEVRLVDDDGDGIPDRGVIEAPTGLPFGRGFGPGRGPSTMLRIGSCFGPGHGLYFGRGFGPHFGRGFGPFFIVGGLFRLAFLALLIGLAVACFRCWKRNKEASAKQFNPLAE